jgi:hypothetical protein
MYLIWRRTCFVCLSRFQCNFFFQGQCQCIHSTKHVVLWRNCSRINLFLTLATTGRLDVVEMERQTLSAREARSALQELQTLAREAAARVSRRKLFIKLACHTSLSLSLIGRKSFQSNEWFDKHSSCVKNKPFLNPCYFQHRRNASVVCRPWPTQVCFEGSLSRGCGIQTCSCRCISHNFTLIFYDAEIIVMCSHNDYFSLCTSSYRTRLLFFVFERVCWKLAEWWWSLKHLGFIQREKSETQRQSSASEFCGPKSKLVFSEKWDNTNSSK